MNACLKFLASTFWLWQSRNWQKRTTHKECVRVRVIKVNMKLSNNSPRLVRKALESVSQRWLMFGLRWNWIDKWRRVPLRKFCPDTLCKTIVSDQMKERLSKINDLRRYSATQSCRAPLDTPCRCRHSFNRRRFTAQIFRPKFVYLAVVGDAMCVIVYVGRFLLSFHPQLSSWIKNKRKEKCSSAKQPPMKIPFLYPIALYRWNTNAHFQVYIQVFAVTS